MADLHHSVEYRTHTPVHFVIPTRRAVQLPCCSASSNLRSLAQSLDLSLPRWYGQRTAGLSPAQGHTQGWGAPWGILSLSYTRHGNTSPVHQDLGTVTCLLNLSELHMGLNNLDLFFLHHFAGICAHRKDRLQAGHLLLRWALTQTHTSFLTHHKRTSEFKDNARCITGL